MKNKAFGILNGGGTSTSKRAEQYTGAAQRHCEKNIIEKLQDDIQEKKDKIFSLKDMSLKTNNNAGISAVSQERASENFEKIIKLEYEIKLDKKELKFKKAAFDKYFGVEKKEEKAVEETKE
jgi:hypothetical protein